MFFMADEPSLLH